MEPATSCDPLPIFLIQGAPYYLRKSFIINFISGEALGNWKEYCSISWRTTLKCIHHDLPSFFVKLYSPFPHLTAQHIWFNTFYKTFIPKFSTRFRKCRNAWVSQTGWWETSFNHSSMPIIFVSQITQQTDSFQRSRIHHPLPPLQMD